MNDTERLAELLHEYHVGCLEDLPGDPVSPGDDERTHRKDARRLRAAGVRLSTDDGLRAALTVWLREQSAAAERMTAGPGMGPGVDPADIAWHEGAKHMADAVLAWLADHE